MIIYMLLALAAVLIYVHHKTKSQSDLESLASYYGDRCWTVGDEVVDAEVYPFKVNIKPAQLDDFQERIRLTKLPQPSLTDTGFTYGVNSKFANDVLQYWKDSFDWKKQEEILNKFPQFKTKIEGLDIHFLHLKPKVLTRTNQAKPLMLVHGWPGSYYEFYKIIPMLTNPISYGGNETDLFEVIVPSIPGFGFSQAAEVKGFSSLHCARIFHKLMLRLGHRNYYLQGGDCGSMITTHMSMLYPNSVKGLHINFNVSGTTPMTALKVLVGSFAPSLFFNEKIAKKLYPLKGMVLNQLLETGYMHFQATKPDTIGYPLSDSPLGLAAYILEKFSTWTDEMGREKDDGDILRHWTYDELLTNIMIYWWNGNITSSMRFYKETLSDATPTAKVKVLVPVGYACFPDELNICIRSQLESTYKRVLSFTHMKHGGHFAAFQVPQLLVEDIRNFVRLSEKEEKKLSFNESEYRQQFKQTHLDRVNT